MTFLFLMIDMITNPAADESGVPPAGGYIVMTLLFCDFLHLIYWLVR